MGKMTWRQLWLNHLESYRDLIQPQLKSLAECRHIESYQGHQDQTLHRKIQ